MAIKNVSFSKNFKIYKSVENALYLLEQLNNLWFLNVII